MCKEFDSYEKAESHREDLIGDHIVSKFPVCIGLSNELKIQEWLVANRKSIIKYLDY